MTRKQAIAEFAAGKPGTKAFKTLGIPFEYFLRFAQFSETKATATCKTIVEHLTRPDGSVRRFDSKGRLTA